MMMISSWDLGGKKLAASFVCQSILRIKTTVVETLPWNGKGEGRKGKGRESEGENGLKVDTTIRHRISR